MSVLVSKYNRFPQVNTRKSDNELLRRHPEHTTIYKYFVSANLCQLILQGAI
jgi:hypothetical protein